MEVITRHDSTIVTYSSDDAVNGPDPVYGAGSFTCIINNAHLVSHAVKCVPVKVMIPNVIPNVRADQNTINVYTKALYVPQEVVVMTDSTFDVTICFFADTNPDSIRRVSTTKGPGPLTMPAGRYTPTAYADKFNELFNANKQSGKYWNKLEVEMSYDTSTSVMSLVVTGFRKNVLKEWRPDIPPTIGCDNWGILIEDGTLDYANLPGDPVHTYTGDAGFYTQLGLPIIDETLNVGNWSNVRSIVNCHRQAEQPSSVEDLTPDLTDWATVIPFQNVFEIAITSVPNIPFILMESVKVPQGRYIGETLADSVNSASTLIRLTYDSDTTQFQFTLSNALSTNSQQEMELYVGVSKDIRDMMGITNIQTQTYEGVEVFRLGGKGESITSNTFVKMGGTPLVYVVSLECAPNNCMGSDGNRYNVLCSVPLHEASFGQYACYLAPDVFVDDVDYRTARSMSQATFHVLDHRFRPVYIDPRFPVTIKVKCYHKDTKK